jgi:ferredoxin
MLPAGRTSLFSLCLRAASFTVPGFGPVEYRDGETMLSAMLRAGIDIKHPCNGHVACGACAVIIDDAHVNTSPITEDEEDTLDVLPVVLDTTRLACAFHLTPEFENAKVSLWADQTF